MRRVFPANDNPRCPTCGTRPDLCICEGLETLHTPLRFLFVQHTQEALKPTNSARLACRMVAGASIVPWNRVEPPELPEGTILLYPSAEATELEPAELVEGITIAIPDGTWSQASRIASILARQQVRRRTLPPGIVADWGLRHASSPERISSAQAVAFVLGLRGRGDAAEGLTNALSEAGRRILSMRGIVSQAPVPGC